LLFAFLSSVIAGHFRHLPQKLYGVKGKWLETVWCLVKMRFLAPVRAFKIAGRKGSKIYFISMIKSTYEKDREKRSFT